jgi:hypothetical protein
VAGVSLSSLWLSENFHAAVNSYTEIYTYNFPNSNYAKIFNKNNAKGGINLICRHESKKLAKYLSSPHPTFKLQRLFLQKFLKVERFASILMLKITHIML